MQQEAAKNEAMTEPKIDMFSAFMVFASQALKSLS